jgi:hypothetical protein
MICKQPYLNPIRFHDAVNGQFAIDMKPSFEYRRGYVQKFTLADFVYLQFHFPVLLTSFVIYLYEYVNGTDVLTDTIATQQITDINFPGLYSYEMPTYNFPDEGIFYLKAEIQIGTQASIMYSEPIKVADSFPKTIVLFYNHNINDFDTLFTTGNCHGMMIRIEGGMKSGGFQPGGIFDMYHDLDYVSEQLNATPFNVEKFTFGPGYGMPNYMIDKLNRLLSLSEFRIDGTQYVRADGAKFERAGVDEYPLAGWSIDLVRKENQFSEDINMYGDPVRPLTWDSSIITFDNSVVTFDQNQI